MELVINFSGGKDSCAMLAYLCEQYPHVPKHVVFANTGWEHTDAEQWATAIVQRFGLQLQIVKSSTKDFFSMVRRRGKFPSPAIRQCTSDLKKGPIEKWIRNHCTENIIINCMGLRSQESTSRANRPALRRNKTLTNSKRTVWDWLPIKSWSDEKVYGYLSERNIPLHPAYRYLKRFSCRVCIFMSLHDLHAVKENDPTAFEQIANLEREIGFSMKPGFYLDQLPPLPNGQQQLSLFG